MGNETKNIFVVTAIIGLLQSKNLPINKTLDILHALFAEEKLSFGIGIHITFTSAMFPNRNIFLYKVPIVTTLLKKKSFSKFAAACYMPKGFDFLHKSFLHFSDFDIVL